MSTPISFYDLPPELREMVYIHALVKTQGIAFPIRGAHLKAQEDISLGLLSASKLISSEALPVFFGMNTFNVDCTDMDKDVVLRQIHRMGRRAKVNMRMIKSYAFLYHSQARAQSRNNAAPGKGTNLKIQILPRTPFYSIGGFHLGTTDIKDATVAYLVQDMFLYRGVRSFATNDILDIATFVRDFSKACVESQSDP